MEELCLLLGTYFPSKSAFCYLQTFRQNFKVNKCIAESKESVRDAGAENKDRIEILCLKKHEN